MMEPARGKRDFGEEGEIGLGGALELGGYEKRDV